MTYARQKFVKSVYDIYDVIDELEALINEYDQGLPILQNTEWFHKELPNLKEKCRKVLLQWNSEDDDDCKPFVMDCE